MPIGNLAEDFQDLERKLNEGIDHAEVLVCTFGLGEDFDLVVMILLTRP